MFVAMSSFTVANGMTDAVREAFVRRPHRVENAPGFVRMDVISPHQSPDEFWLLTYWTDEASYRAWHRNDALHESHRGVPRGLKLVPHSARVRFFEHITS